ncbi:hypothetical protein [Parvularcula sp. IMCC14364]|uniref:hypothetical protein n=1 Tax=Parvularcula sp. IMCC14364 TaxID=3067902 RepID=UPI002740BA0E|nr:hypothetical protein [Parvularcula sp. IMCC14364]
MMALAKRNVPGRCFDISGIDRLGQNFGDALVADNAVPIAWKLRKRLEEAFHFNLKVEAT